MKVVAAIIEREDKKILLALRAEGRHLAGYWEFPGGKVEEGESPEVALRRELQEELSLDVRVVKRLGTYSHKYDQVELELDVYLVHPVGEPKVSADVPDFHWTDPKEATTFRLAPADIEPLKDFLISSQT